MYKYLFLLFSLTICSFHANAQNSCMYELILNDSGEDGWGTAGLSFFNGTVEVEATTLTGQTDTIFIPVTEGDSISISYLNTMSNNEENSFKLLDSDKQVIFEVSNPPSGVLLETFVSCPVCPSLVLGSIINVDSFDNRFVLDWEASDSLGVYNVSYARCGFLDNPDSVQIAQTAFSEITINDLKEKTCYDYSIYLVCSGGDTSIVAGPQSITTIYSVDVGISGVTTPIFGGKCNYLTQDTLEVLIKNYGAVPQTLIPFDFTLKNPAGIVTAGNVSMPSDGLYTGVVAKDSCNAFPFDASINIADPGEYTLDLWTALDGDSDPSNDRITISFIHTFSLPFYENFELNKLSDRWSSSEDEPTIELDGSFVASGVLDGLNSKYTLETPRYGYIKENDELEFEYSFTGINVSDDAPVLTLGDELLVEITTDCGETYTILETVDMNTLPMNDGSFNSVAIGLDSYIDEKVSFRFTALRGSGFFRINLDNINIYDCGNPSIAVPENNVDITGVSGDGGADGSITIAPINGVPPYTFVWSNSVTPLFGTTSTIENLDVGEYSVSISDSQNCGPIVFTWEVGIDVSTNDISDVKSLSLFPNPVSDNLKLQVELNSAQAITTNIFNSIGQQVWLKSFVSTDRLDENINVRNFDSGIYFMTIQTTNGLEAKRFIVE